jgi:chromosome segregation ATPase
MPKLKLNKDGRIVNAETDEVFTVDGQPVEIEGLKTQEDIQAAIDSKTATFKKQQATLEQALKEAKANESSSQEQINALQKMLDETKAQLQKTEKEAEARVKQDLQKLTKAVSEAKAGEQRWQQALHKQLITNAVLSQAGVKGREFLNPDDLLLNLERFAKIAEERNEKGEVVLDQSGFPKQVISFEMEIDEIDKTTNKPTGSKIKEFLPVDKAAEHIAKQKPWLIKGANRTGIGGDGTFDLSRGNIDPNSVATMSPAEYAQARKDGKIK